MEQPPVNDRVPDFLPCQMSNLIFFSEGLLQESGPNLSDSLLAIVHSLLAKMTGRTRFTTRKNRGCFSEAPLDTLRANVDKKNLLAMLKFYLTGENLIDVAAV